jgi:hypothetical protein
VDPTKIGPPQEKICPKSWRGPSKSWGGGPDPPPPPRPPSGCALAATGFTPYFLVHGRHANLPYDYLSQHPSAENYESYDDFTMQVDERLHYAFDLVRKKFRASFERNKRCYDERVRELQFKPGDLVWQ